MNISEQVKSHYSLVCPHMGLDPKDYSNPIITTDYSLVERGSKLNNMRSKFLLNGLYEPFKNIIYLKSEKKTGTAEHETRHLIDFDATNYALQALLRTDNSRSVNFVAE